LVILTGGFARQLRAQCENKWSPIGITIKPANAMVASRIMDRVFNMDSSKGWAAR